MHTVRKYPDPVRAESAAAYLTRHGVLARVAGGGLNALGPYSGSAIEVYEVAIAMVRLRERAEMLIRAFEAEVPAPAGAEWEDEAEPDLSRLDPSLAIRCPACGRQLRRPLGARCTDCGEAIDLLSAVLGQHGPEALEACYATDADPGADVDWDALPFSCGCGYELDHLARAGRCPECGTAYDKRETAMRWLRSGNR